MVIIDEASQMLIADTCFALKYLIPSTGTRKDENWKWRKEETTKKKEKHQENKRENKQQRENNEDE